MDPTLGARPTRIVLVDDDPVVRRGLRMWLELEPDFEVVGEAGDGAEALQVAAALRPDVVLMDDEMPRLDGIAATAALLRLFPGTRVIVQSMYAGAPSRARALAAGAAAFFGKGTGATDLLAAIRRLTR